MGKTRKSKKPAARQTVSARMDDRRIEYLTVGLILIAASVLILANLGNIYLWQDEAQTACVAKTILTHGVPLGFDGTNSLSQVDGLDYAPKSHVWLWHPWFPFYLLAAFYSLFGVSTLIARLPFALFGIATVVLAYLFGRDMWKSRRTGILAAAVLLVSVPFILLTRQCRYYSPDIFFSLLGLYQYQCVLEGRKRAGLWFGLAAFLLFHTHYVHCAALLGTAFLHSLLFRRDRLRTVLIASAVVVLLNVPWLVFFSGMSSVIESRHFLGMRAVRMCDVLIIRVVQHVFHPALLAIPIAVALVRMKRHVALRTDRVQGVALLLMFIIVSLLANAVTAEGPLFRYLGPLVPAFALLIGLMLDQGMGLHPAVALVTIVLMGWWLRMPSYLYEITHDFKGPVEGIAQYLNLHARPTDVVICPQEDMPLKFYTELRVIGALTGENPALGLNADWIIMRVHGDRKTTPMKIYLNRNVDWTKYEEITLDYPDTQNENREDPEEHLFRTEEMEEPVILCHRITR